jgi:hypothetical protein
MTIGDNPSIQRACSRTEQTLHIARERVKELEDKQTLLHSKINWENPDINLLRKLNLVNHSLEVANARCVRTIPQCQLRLNDEIRID